jgi:hypothetical protein
MPCGRLGLSREGQVRYERCPHYLTIPPALNSRKLQPKDKLGSSASH